ncbi:MAG: universal stress protein [Oligoflexales bacterium]
MSLSDKHFCFFVNPDGSNDYVVNFIKTIGKQEVGHSDILTLAETLPAYAAFPDKNRKNRIEQVLKNAAGFAVDKFVELLKVHGVENTKSTVLEGRFPAALEQWLSGHKVDLLVKESLPCDGQFGLASKGDLRLARHSPAPVFLVHSEVQKGAPLLVGLPPVHSDGRGLNLAVKLLKKALEWAEVLKSKLHVVRAWELFGESYLRTHGAVDELESELETAKKQTEQEVKQVIDAVKNPALVEMETHVFKGDPTRVLMGAIDMFHPTVAILGSIANEGVKGILLGNTAEIIARRRSVSVMIVR